MAATELSSGSPRPTGTASQWAVVYGVIWAITLAGAIAVAAIGAPARAFTTGLLGLTLNPKATPAPTVGRVLALSAHNLALAAWPLLLSYAGACRRARGRMVADTAVGVSLLANVLPVGAALGAYGSALSAYVPQLPLEWAGLAVGYAAWCSQRRRTVSLRERARWLALITLLLISAAVLETIAVPHQSLRGNVSGAAVDRQAAEWPSSSERAPAGSSRPRSGTAQRSAARVQPPGVFGRMEQWRKPQLDVRLDRSLNSPLRSSVRP
jgi:hypothetical protein